LQSAERLRLRHTAEERERIQDYASQYAREIGDLLRRMPRPLLLLLKTNDCLRWGQCGNFSNPAHRHVCVWVWVGGGRGLQQHSSLGAG
jgi:hypothetical protein